MFSFNLICVMVYLHDYLLSRVRFVFVLFLRHPYSIFYEGKFTYFRTKSGGSATTTAELD